MISIQSPIQIGSFHTAIHQPTSPAGKGPGSNQEQEAAASFRNGPSKDVAPGKRDQSRRGPYPGGKNTQDPAQPPGDANGQLTSQELQLIRQLERRDKEVRAHEQAHIAAGGQYVRSGASYQYETGPDGKRYAVGGEVSIDTSEERDPRATIRKMETVRRAALAPAHPSSKDRAVAAEAQIKAAKAAAEIAAMKKGQGGKDRAQTAGETTKASKAYQPYSDIAQESAASTQTSPVINAYA